MKEKTMNRLIFWANFLAIGGASILASLSIRAMIDNSYSSSITGSSISMFLVTVLVPIAAYLLIAGVFVNSTLHSLKELKETIQ